MGVGVLLKERDRLAKRAPSEFPRVHCAYNERQAIKELLEVEVQLEEMKDLPDLFLHSMSYPVMGLFPSKPMVHLRVMVRAFTSLISISGGSGGSVWSTENLG